MSKIFDKFLDAILDACYRVFCGPKPATPETPTIPEPEPHLPPQPPTNKTHTKDISDAHAYLQERWPLLKAKFEEKYPEYTLKLTFVWRSKTYQNKLYQIGRRKKAGEKIVTYKDGFKKLSKHNHYPALAFDAAIFRGNNAVWTPSEYEKLTTFAVELGLIHGLTWKNFKDPQHFQCPSRIK